VFDRNIIAQMGAKMGEICGSTQFGGLHTKCVVYYKWK
jgi:hypothetical protein